MRVQYDVMVQEFARVLEKKGFTHEDAENAAIIFAQNSLAGVYSHGLNRKIGNNPLIMAVPRSNGEHAMIDCAVSQFSYGIDSSCIGTVFCVEDFYSERAGKKSSRNTSGIRRPEMGFSD